MQDDIDPVSGQAIPVVSRRQQILLAERMADHLLTPSEPSEFAIRVLEEFGMIHDDDIPSLPVDPFTPEELEGIDPVISDSGTHYAKRWDERIMYGGGLGVRAETPMSQGWAMYSRFAPNAGRHDFIDFYGKPRWLTDAGFRVMCEAIRLAVIGTTVLTTAELAELAKVSRSTASRTVQKLTAWGMLAAVTVRGRYGGLVLFTRAQGDSLEHYAQDARNRIRQGTERRLLRLISKCASIYPALGVWVSTYFTTSVVRMGAHLDFEREDRSERLAEALGCDPSRGSGRVPCPAHGEGRSRTLSWKREGDRLLIHCFAGCTYDEIRRAAVG